MVKHIAKSFLGMIITLFAVITISFFIVRLAPGGPFDRERPLPPAIVENLEIKYGLDKPVIIQYFRYLGGVLRGDLGESTSHSDYPVSYYIQKSLPNSLLLGMISIMLALILGVTMGVFSALKQNSALDYISMSIAIIGITVPLFVVGPVLVYLFAIKLQWLPTSGWISSGDPRTFIMPIITLSLIYFGRFSRLARGSMLEVLSSNFIRTAKAKGLPGKLIIVRHALKGAMLPVASFFAPAFVGAITGSVVVESIFRIPGIGIHFVQSAINRDYFLLLGTVIVYASILIVMNFIVDIVYSLLDPRIAYK